MFNFLRSQLVLLNENPVVGYVDNFLTIEECDHIINIGKPNLSRAMVMNNTEGGKKLHSARTNSNAWIKHNTDTLIKSIVTKISNFVKIPLSHAEQFSLLEYQVGQEYRPHYDACDLPTVGGKEKAKFGHQRILTTLIYLNTPIKGGGTFFPNLNSTIPAVQQRMAVFVNTTDDLYTRPPESKHGGNPVIEGVKYAATLWFRVNERTTKYTFPCDNPPLLKEWMQ